MVTMAGKVAASLVFFGALSGAVAADVRWNFKWGQTNTTIFVSLEQHKECQHSISSSAHQELVHLEFNRLRIPDTACSAEPMLIDFELREDINVNESRVEGKAAGVNLVLRKAMAHRWDRLLWDETQAVVARDWKREDPNLLEEDEYELPRGQNIRLLTYETLAVEAAQRTVVIAMRYPWCTHCEEKDIAFTKASKVIGTKPEFEHFLFATLDAREQKKAARRWGVTCIKDKCPLHVFKPDETLDEPYSVELQLLYEMDEVAMMADPMAGSPGHMPKPSSVKPNFERLEKDLGLLSFPALVELPEKGSVADFRGRWDHVVLGYGVDYTDFRRTARSLRGDAAFALVTCPEVLATEAIPKIELWSSTLSFFTMPLTYTGTLNPLDPLGLERFVRIHSKPLVQNYLWDVKKQYEAIGLSIAVLWVNYSNLNQTEATSAALRAFERVCQSRRGVNDTHDVLCIVQDESHSYYQREYGTYEPYPYPYLGLATKLSYGEGDRYGYPFREPLNQSVVQFWSKTSRAVKDINMWMSRIFRGRVPPSHESGNMPTSGSAWTRGEVQEIVWKTYQHEINGSTADVLLELYDDQRKQSHMLSATMRVVALTLKDYSTIKVARLETSANYVPKTFGRKAFSKDTEYFWVPPSIASGEWTPGRLARYNGPIPATPERLLKFFKKHTHSHWSLSEALEVAADLSETVLGQAKALQKEADRADSQKQEMIQDMMKSLKKEKGLVDVGEMMGLKKAADAMGGNAPAAGSKQSRYGKESSPKATEKDPGADTTEVDPVKEREARKRKLDREEAKFRESERKEKQKRSERRAKEKLQKAKKAEEAKKQEDEAREKRRLKQAQLQVERALAPTTPFFSWAQSKDAIRVAVRIPDVRASTLNVTLLEDEVHVSANDSNSRQHRLDFDLREYIWVHNSTWAIRYSEALEPKADGVMLTLQKVTAHRWDRLVHNIAAVKSFMRKDWLQDDGDLEEEEEIDLPSGQNIKRITAAALDTMMQKHHMAVVAARFPWCDKCVEKDRHFVKAARNLRSKEHLANVAFLLIDAREEKAFAKKHNVTCHDDCNLHIFKEDEPGEPYTIPGRQFVEEIEIDCYKHILPVVNEVEDEERFTRMTSALDTAIVGFFRETSRESTWFQRFRHAARELRGHALFGAVFGLRQPKEFGIEHERRPVDGNGSHPLVLLFKPKENRHVEFEGDLSLGSLTRFSRVLSLPLVSTYDFEMRKKYQELKVPLGMLWTNPEDKEGSHNAVEVLRRLAHRFSGHLVFVTLNNTRDGLLMRPLGLDPRRVPSFGISSSEELNADKFAFDRHRESPEALQQFWADSQRAFDELEEFCSLFLNGSLELSHESSELPPSYEWLGPGYVDEVVWKSFASSIYQSKEDILLELFSPSRPQQRTHISTLDLVAESLSAVGKVKVARMDTANNYVPAEFGNVDKEKSSTIFFLPSPASHGKLLPKRFAQKAGKALAIPEKLLRFVHRETQGRIDWDIEAAVTFAKQEAGKRIKKLRELEKDYERKMQDEWMQKEIEEFERYKRLGKFDHLPHVD